MQSVILAAGSSKRTYPLTLTRPKPLLKVANKEILSYNIEAIKDFSDEIILVVGYKKNMIEDFIKKNYSNLKIKLVKQKEQLGTGHAVSMIKSHIKDKFLLLMGDNIYSKQDTNKILKYRYSLLVKEVSNPELFGVVIENNGIVADVIEKPKKPASNLVSCALYSLDKNIFDLLTSKKSERNEYELTDAIKSLANKEKVYCIHSSSCWQISHPWDLLEADKKLRGSKTLIGNNSKILGNVKNSSIGNNCIIKGNIKNSIIMDKTIIDEDSIVEDSIIGEGVYFKGVAKSLNNISSMIKGKEVIAKKLGAIIADNVIAKNVNIKAGCKIWPGKIIKGEIKNDIQ